jgi:protocatechuate 3,4-dioxygenase beta subunit
VSGARIGLNAAAQSTGGSQTDSQRGARGASVRPKRPSQQSAAQAPGGNAAQPAKRGAAASMKASGPTLGASLEPASPILASTDFNLIGLAVTADPASQSVPKNTPTRVLTSIQAPEGADIQAIVAGLNPNYRVRGELVGPSFGGPRPVEAAIGQPIPIPPLSQTGEHVVQNLRVVDISLPGEPVVAPVTPDACGVVVFDRLLVSEVHVNELSYDQIIQAGINISDDSYQAFNFTLGIGTISDGQSITIPVAFPQVGVTDPRPIVGTPTISAPGIDVPTIVPVMLTQDEEEEGEDGGGKGPPMFGDEPVRIPGVIVFPGRVGFLHQFFEAIVIVSNGAPGGTPLVIRGLHAKAKLPDAGTPGVESDDPLRIAETQVAGRVSELDLHGLGPDQKYGTGDDTTTFTPGQAGQATFLLEGLKEGLHTVNFGLEAELDGLPGGTIHVSGEVPGAVLVRDASFAVTFTHPSVVRAGQEYDLAMTVYNSGSRDILGAFARLTGNSISGAELLNGDTGTRQFPTTIKRKDSATVKWRLRSNTTGAVTASYVKVGDDVSAGLQLVTGVGDRNVPLSPDSLILPDPVRHLPPGVVEAARALLGQAWSVANAPAGSLPEGVTPITKQGVIDRAVELGIAGVRVDFGEPASVSLDTLVRDWLGELKPDAGFADALRATPAGNTFYDAVGAEVGKSLTSATQPVSPADFQKEFADTESPRSPFISAIASQSAGQPVAGLRLVDPGGKRIGFGETEAEARRVDLQSSAALALSGTGASAAGQLALVSNPAEGNWTLVIEGWRDGTIDLSLLYPSTGRSYRQVNWNGVTIAQGVMYRVFFRTESGAGAPTLEAFTDNAWHAVAQGSATDISQPAPRLVGAIQVTPDVIPGGDKYGRLIGLLFSKPMLKEQAETIAKYTVGGGQLKNSTEMVGGPVKVRGANIDYGDRFVFLALDSPIGPYIRRDITVSTLNDTHNMALTPAPSTRDIDPRVSPQGRPPGAYLTGRVLNADGTPVPNAPVVYWTQECPDPSRAVMPPPPKPIAIRYTDAQGRYELDYVRDGDCAPLSVTVNNPVTKAEKRLTSPVAYDGQHMVFDMVFLARGSVRGTVMSGGHPVAKAFVQVIPQLDAVAAKVAQTDDSGNYSVSDIPVGNISVTAVGTGDLRTASGLAAGTIPGPNQTAIINVSLQNVSGVVSGRVLNPDNTPQVGALVVAYARIAGFNSQRADGAIAVGYAYADREGAFTIKNLPVTNISLELTDYVTGLFIKQTVQLTTAAPEVSGVLLRLPGTGTVTGRVTDETGRGVPGAAVRAAGGSVNTDFDGYYTLQGLRAGTLTITASDPVTKMGGGTTATVRLGEVTAGANITILRPAFVEGRVFKVAEGETTPKPLAGAKVTPDGFTIVETDSQGNYRLENVPTGHPITLRFVDEEKALAVNMSVVLSPGETLTRDATLRSGNIRGRITQPDGVTGVIADVAIFAQRPTLELGFDYGLLSSDPPSLTRSAADGSYSVSGLNPGTFRVTTSNVFFPTPVSGGGSLAPGGTAVCDLSLVSTLAGKIQGHVFQPDGETPAPAGTRVTLGGGSLADAAVRTDENGHYEFGEVFSAGGYALTATDPTTGYTNRIGVSVQKNKDAVFDLRLLGTGNLKVKVVNGAGQPVTSGSVTLDGSKFPNQSRFAELTPDGAGIIEFTNLPEGPYAVAASDHGLGGRVSVNVPLGASVETTIQLQASGTVEGRVLMPDGATPVGLADVELRVAGRSVGFAVTSDDEGERGKFKFLSVPSGGFTLDVFDNRTGRVGRSGGRIDTQGETATVDVTLVPVGAVSGRVTSNGQPVDHALVQIYADGSGVRSEHLKATSDSDGRYRFTGIPVGRVRVDVSEGPGGQGGSATGNVTGTAEPLPDTVIDVTLEPSQTVTGTVFNAGGTEPLPGAQVVINISGREFRTATNESGVYRLGFLPLGQVRVRAEAPTGYDRGESATVAGTQVGATLTVNLTLSGVGTITGTASDSNGSPLAVGTVIYTNDAWSPPIVVNVPVFSGGRYEITNMPAGPFRLSLTAPNRVGGGTALGTIVAGQSLDLAIRLEDAGRILGTVKTADGSAPVTGADVTLTLSRPGLFATFYTHTNSAGAWSFENVPLGTASVRVTEPTTGAVARSLNNQLATNGQTLDLGELRLHANDYGTVRGTVTGSNGQLLSGVTITLAASNGTFNATTSSNGLYSFEPVDVGDFTVDAVDAGTGFRAHAAGRINNNEQVSTVNLQLFPTGTVTGIVLRHDNTTPVAGAGVTLTSNFDGRHLNATADAQGRYTFESVPVANFSVDAYDAATGDRGSASGQLTFNGQSRAVNVRMVGFGRVVVTVRDASGVLTAGAHVRLVTQTYSTPEVTLDSQADGTATFENVIAGSFYVDATDPRTNLRASGSGSVQDGATTNVAVQLQPVGTITGRIFAPGGTTPAPGITVRLGSYGNDRYATSGDDGTYRFDDVPINYSYYMIVQDALGRQRNVVGYVMLTANGQVMTRDLTLVGIGTVTGKVVNPDGSFAQNVYVTISSNNAAYGVSYGASAVTDYTGAFTFRDVPAGRFTLYASDEPRGLQGDNSAELTTDGSTVTANVNLVSNAISLPTYRYDANNFTHNISNAGTNNYGTYAVFSAGAAYNLDVISGGAETRFTGSSFGTIEEGGREVAIRQQNVGGVNVTRKIYVPRDGYFVRYLEMLNNPSSSPVTVSLRVQNNLGGCYYYCTYQQLFSTSSGDAAFDVSNPSTADRWVVADDDNDVDPFFSGRQPATAFVFDGEGGSQHAGSASYSVLSYYQSQLSYQWNDVTIQPGETVAYMHFGLQQANRASARASAERLVQLPPESLAGLSEAERGEVRNFSVPADGASTLTALPALAGNVGGRVFAGDNTTPIANAYVEFTGTSPYYSRTYYTYAGADGSYGFATSLNDNGTSTAIALQPFTVYSRHPQSSVLSPVSTGNFAPSETNATQNIVFTDTGSVRGVVQRPNGQPVTGGGSITLYHYSPSYFGVSTQIAADGSYAFSGVPGGDYTLSVTAYNSQGTSEEASQTVTVPANATATANVTLAAVGNVNGTLHNADGSPAAYVWTYLYSQTQGGFYRQAPTDGSGHFLFTEVPVGPYTLASFEPYSGSPTSVTVTVTADQTITQDLTFPGIGRAQVQANNANGTPAPGIRVDVKRASHDYWEFGGYTDGAGRLLIDNVPEGQFTVRAYSPNTYYTFSDATGAVTANAQVVPVTVTLPATGTVSGRVLLGNGQPSEGSYVYVEFPWISYERQSYRREAYTDSNGNYAITDVEVGRAFTFGAAHPTNGNLNRYLYNQHLTSDGQTLTIDVNFSPTATLRVTVLKADGTPYTNVPLALDDSLRDYFLDIGRTNSSGVLTVSDIPVGEFKLYARSSNGSTFVASTAGTIPESSAGQTFNVTLREVRGNVEGTVYTAGVPRPGSRVDVYDATSGWRVGGATTDAQGKYRVNNVPAGDGGLRVTGFSPRGNVSADGTGRFNAPGETVTIDITLPGGLVRGRVYASDGTTPVPSPFVWLSQNTLTDGNDITTTGTGNADGTYFIDGVGAGEFTVYAQARGSWLTGTATGTVVSAGAPTDLDVTLPPSGNVQGVVRNTDGSPVSNALVSLTSGNNDAELRVYTDFEGRYNFEGVALGSFYVQAAWNGRYGSASGTINNPGETVNADITFPATTTVSGRVFRADGTTAVADARVYVEGFSNAGPRGRYAVAATANSSGDYTVNGVPAGIVRVTAFDPNDFKQAGENEFTLGASPASGANVTLGGLYVFGDDATLSGADGFKYVFWADGDMDDSGTLDGTVGPAYNGSFYLTMQHSSWWYFNTVQPARDYTSKPEDGGREYQLGYDNMMGLLVKRKVFVPAEGGFARYLEILRNPTDHPLSVQVGMESWFGYLSSNFDTRFTSVVRPSETGNTYAVTRFNEPCCYPALGHVFAGPNARVPVNDVAVWNEDDSDSRSIYHWNVTVPAGQTVILMHFTAQRQPDDTAGAQAQAEALVNLSDPKALQGMSEEEKAAVVNFQIGAGSGGGKVTVQVNRVNGSSMANAAVYIRESAHGDATRPVGKTDSQGRLTINGVALGAFTVRAYGPGGDAIFGEASGAIASGGETVPVTVTISEGGSVGGRITYPNQTPAANASVEVSGPDMPTRRVSADANGNYTVNGLPLNRPFTVKATDGGDPNINVTSATLTLTEEGHQLSADFALPKMWTWVWGHIYAADGQTPVPYSNVEVLDAETGQRLEPWTYQSSSDGVFVTGWLLVGPQGVRVRATRSFAEEFVGEIAATFTPSDPAIGNVNLTLSVPVVKGTVRRADGTPVPYPQVRIRQADANGVEQEDYVYTVDDQGNYATSLRSTGAFTVLARDPEGLSGTASGTAPNVTAVVQLDVTLPAGMTVSGTVKDASGTPVPYAYLAVSSSGVNYDRNASTDEQGRYTVERVAAGRVFVNARHPETNVGALGFGTAGEDGSAQTIDVNLPGTGTIKGKVMNADGTPAWEGMPVRVENFGGAGGLGHFTQTAYTDGTGNYEATNVQAGTVRVAAFPYDPQNGGVAQATVTASQTTQANVTLGTAVVSWFYYGVHNLDGADGFRYDIERNGELVYGGTADGRLPNAYNYSHYLSLNDNWWFYNETGVATFEDNGREKVVGQDSWGGVQMARKVYVPAEGGFARYLEVLTNSADRPLTFRVGMDGSVGYGENTRIADAPAQNGNTFAVMFDHAGERPSLADVMAGQGAAVPVSSAQFGADGYFNYAWTVTLQPGQTVILMHFTLQREPGDAAGAKAAAEALSNLSDPRALEGMSAEERAQVVNFSIQSGANNAVPSNNKKTAQGGNVRTVGNNASAITHAPVAERRPAAEGGGGDGRPEVGARRGARIRSDFTERQDFKKR